MNQNAHVKEKKSIYIVWIIPLVAMLIAGWMIFKHYDEKGTDIVITFDSGNGLVVGKTPLKFNGIKIGQVSDIDIHKGNITKVDVTVTVDKNAVFGVLREGNIFWKVEPRLSLTEVTGLSTILGGVYIGLMPAGDTKEKLLALPVANRFVAKDEVPVNFYNKGLKLILHAHRYDIKVGAPLMYRKINVGKIIETKLTDAGVDYTVHINEKYTYLIKKDSKFWKVSGLEIKASLSGLRVKMDSFASLVTGGISLDSPENSEILTTKNSEFELYENKNALDLAKEVITLVAENAHNIDYKMAEIYFKGFMAGKILSMEYKPNINKTIFKIKLEKQFSHLANIDAYFWIVEPHIGLTSIEGLGALASGPYISFETSSKSKELKSKFTLFSDSPDLIGKHYKLEADASYKLKDGVNVLYKDIVIGRLEKVNLSKNKKKVVFDIIIASKYTYLVNDTSDFYLESAIEMGASFEGVYLNIGSISSMANSGIVLSTRNLKARKTLQSFFLLKDFKTLEKKNYKNSGGQIFSLVSKNLHSIQVGSPVLYKGLNVGRVLSFKLDKQNKRINIKIYIEKEYTDQVNISTSFYNRSGIQIKASFEGVKVQTGSFETMVRGGIAFHTPLEAKSAKSTYVFELFEDKDAVDTKYIDIKFFTKEESGIKKGGSILYKSIIIGQVKKVKLIGNEIIIDAVIQQDHEDLLVKDSIFWVEDIHIGIEEVKNPSAILTGAFIKVQRGHSLEKSKKFALTTVEPVSTLNKKGLRVLVTGIRLGGLNLKSPVFYRQIEIGSVESFKLSDDAKGVDIKLYIHKCYQYLVHEDSLFYNATAFGVDVSLFGVKVSTETISTMIKGGITMVTPESESLKAKDMHAFKLYTDPKEEWLEYQPTLINDDESCKEAR